MHVGQKTNCSNQFSLSIMWVPEFNPWSSGLAPSSFTCWAVSTTLADFLKGCQDWSLGSLRPTYLKSQLAVFASCSPVSWQCTQRCSPSETTTSKNEKVNRMWWYMSVILVLERQRQDNQMFRVILCYIVSRKPALTAGDLSQKTKQTKQQMKISSRVANYGYMGLGNREERDD